MKRLYFCTSFFLINLILICWVDTSTFVIVSFMLNNFIISYGFYYSIRTQDKYLDALLWVFMYIFMFFAPLIQIKEGYWPNSMAIDDEKIVYVNIFLLIWSLTFLVFRNKKSTILEKKEYTIKHSLTRHIYFIFTSIYSLYFIVKYKIGYFLGLDLVVFSPNISINAIIEKTTLGIVVANFFFAVSYISRHKTIKGYAYTILSFLYLLFFINPFTVSRYYMGFLIITFILLFYHEKINTLSLISIILIGLLLIFPLFNLFRFGFQQISFELIKEEVTTQITKMHFDAYSNFIAVIDYVEKNNYTFGNQLLGVVLFFVPRQIWDLKPTPSGELIGNYLIDKYSLWFNNISCPLPAEFYIDFGIIGLIVGAIAVAIFVNKLEKSYIFYSLICGFSIFILRGSLMPAYIYTVGTLIPVLVVPKFLDKMFFNFSRKVS